MKNLKTLFSSISGTIIVLLIGLSVLLIGSCNKVASPTTPENLNSPITFDMSSPEMIAAMAVQDKYTPELLANPDVVAVGTGVSDDGKPEIIVFINKEKQNIQSMPALKIPKMLENIPVKIDYSDEIRANSTPLIGPYSPVPIGVSTGTYKLCSSGTIGCVVSDGTNRYMLSCNHVLVFLYSGSSGDGEVQPGLGDLSCSSKDSNVIAKLTAWNTIDFSSNGNNYIDAAIAKYSTTYRNFTASTPSGYYGYPNTTTKSATIRMGVQKVGRTTGLTTSTIYAVNTSGKIYYWENNSYAYFSKQITVKSGTFGQAGDSGSLVVTNDKNKNPIGLYFAGSSTVSIMNPIDSVLSYFKRTLNVSGFYICNSD